MSVAVTVALTAPVPQPAPQTFENAWRQFRRQTNALKKQPALAGQIERQLAQNSRQLLREAARETLQAQADAASPHCPVCGAKLRQVQMRERTIQTQWGPVTLRRAYGYCSHCRGWFAPADHALGLDPHTQHSPDLSEKLAWLATQMPPAQAAEVFEHLTGQAASPSAAQRQIEKKGEEALTRRDKDVERALSTEQRFAFSHEHTPMGEPDAFTLVILMDGWMIRERDDWGLSEALRLMGAPARRWHEVKAARLFRLDQRVADPQGRSMVLSSGCVATRQGPERLGELVWTEALRMGAMRAREVLIVADGGVWIWKIAADRFPQARGTLDFYHASEHLWAVAHALFGEGSEAARRWVEPLLHQLRHGEHGRVLKTLADLTQMARELAVGQTLARESNYFESHRAHLDYEAKSARDEPIGSGAMESLCKQYQMRFKRPGQFWRIENEERLLELDNLRRNNRWHTLWPHLSSQN